MSAKIPAISGKDAIKAFKRLGFSVDRVNGSHHVMKKPGHQFVLSVPVHGNSDLARGTLKGLIDASGYTVEEFLEAVK